MIQHREISRIADYGIHAGFGKNVTHTLAVTGEILGKLRDVSAAAPSGRSKTTDSVSPVRSWTGICCLESIGAGRCLALSGVD